MTDRATLWVFGHSGCLPFNLPNGIGWTEQIANKLNISHQNFATAAADNLFIYHSFISNLSKITPNDIVIIGWSHPNRKSFVLDRSNRSHAKAIDNGCMIFDSTPEFFRSQGILTNTKEKWLSMAPQNLGNEFFDTWFERYHHEYECQLNMQAYLGSVSNCVPCKYMPFYFSRDSLRNKSESAFYWLEFIIENQYWISESDLHLSQEGHNKMAELFLQMLDNDLNNLYN